MYLQLSAVAKLDSAKLETLLKATNHQQCIFTAREVKLLQEVTTVFEPAYDATIVMEEETAFISLLAPTVSALQKKWSNMLEHLDYSQSLINALLRSLESRFIGIFNNIGTAVSATTESENDTVPFTDSSYILASALDPEFRMDWVNVIVKCRFKAKLVEDGNKAAMEKLHAYSTSRTSHTTTSSKNRREQEITTVGDLITQSSGVTQTAATETGPRSKRAKLFGVLDSHKRLPSSGSSSQYDVMARVNQAVEALIEGEHLEQHDLTMYSRSQFDILKPLV